MKQVFTALALGTMLMGVPAFAEAEVGKPAPAFTLKDEAGKE
ncbi:MAG TPA: thioredoxin family protein, partial [Myxococcus sp.]|nr:thioredoxin family protein [Myxococcus sp.]